MAKGNSEMPLIGANGFLVRQGNQQNEVEKKRDQMLFKRDATPDDHKCAIQHVKKGIKYYNVKDYHKAVHHFGEALKYDDAYSRAYYYLGNAHYKLRKMTEAICNWKLAVDAEPDSDSAEKARDKLGNVNSNACIVQVVKRPEY